jgi:hypothetical protein
LKTPFLTGTVWPGSRPGEDRLHLDLIVDGLDSVTAEVVGLGGRWLEPDHARELGGFAKSWEETREAVSDRGGGVRSRDERPPTRGVPNHRR